MMYSRLLLARNLLADDGVIFISINDHEKDNLRKICNEIFGEKNFIATLIWDKNHSAQSGIYKVYHEYIIFYARIIDNILSPQSLDNELFEAGAMKKESGRHIMQPFTFPAGTRFDAPDGTEYSGEWGGVEKLRLISGRMVAKEGKLQENVTIEAAYTQIQQMQQFFYGDKDNLFDSRGQKIVEFYLNSSGKVKVVKKRSVETPQTTCRFGAQGPVSVELAKLFGTSDSPFDSPKPVEMIKDFIGRFTNNDDIILDFFGGSSTTAHAVIDLCADNKGESRNFIIVQLQENLDKSLKYASKDGKKTLETAILYLDQHNMPHLLTEIGKERIRRAGEKIKRESSTPEDAGQLTLAEPNPAPYSPTSAPNSTLHSPNSTLDIGFRVFKVADSNMKDVYYAPVDLKQADLPNLIDNIKEDRTALDLLFGCLLDWGLPLSLPYSSEKIGPCTVHTYNGGDLIACFDANIPEDVIREIAKRRPLRAVFRDSGFADAPKRINVFEIFKHYMPESADDIRRRVKVI